MTAFSFFGTSVVQITIINEYEKENNENVTVKNVLKEKIAERKKRLSEENELGRIFNVEKEAEIAMGGQPGVGGDRNYLMELTRVLQKSGAKTLKYG